MKKVLVVGSGGQLGSSIRKIVSEEQNAEFEFIFVDYPEFDLGRPGIIETFFFANKVDVVINCSAYTAVDKAEEEIEKAFVINADAVGQLAKESFEQGAIFIHVSTDYVFNGDGSEPYQIGDLTAPINVYGKSKLAGEKLTLENNPNSYIIRTSWLYSAFGNNFVKSMQKLFKEREELNIVNDQKGCPTSAHDLANIILEILKEDPKKYGLYHFSNHGETTWFGFASKIAEIENSPVKLYPITTDKYPTPAKRPKYSVLNCNKIEKELHWKIRPWEEALSDVLKMLKADNHAD